MVSAKRRAIESLYKGKCNIAEYKKIRSGVTKITKQQQIDVLLNQPCKLSFKSIASTKQTESAALVSQVIKLFLAPEIVVKPGSKITVTQNGVTTSYKNSGEPAYYDSHQELILELFEGWA